MRLACTIARSCSTIRDMRKSRLQIPGVPSWVVFNGNLGLPLFKDRVDYETMTDAVAESSAEFGVDVYAYCWLEKQGHLLADAPLANLSQFMQVFMSTYARRFCVRHRHVGSVFQTRFRSVLVGGDAYLLKASRDIHLMAIRHLAAGSGLIAEGMASLAAFPWSSYRRTAGLDAPVQWLASARVAALAPGTGSAAARYRKFVEQALRDGEANFGERIKSTTLAFGDAEFLQRIKAEEARVRGRWRRGEPPALLEPLQPREDPEAVIAEVCAKLAIPPERLCVLHLHGDHSKGIASLALTRRCGLSYEAVARRFGAANGLTMRAAIQRAREAAKDDPALKALLDELAPLPRRAGR